MRRIFILIFAFFLVHLLLIFFPLESLPLKEFPFQHIASGYANFGLHPLANFDGEHYILIAREGYGEFQQAYFPLYPLLLSFVSPLFLQNYFLSGLAISWVTFFAGFVFFYKFLKGLFPKESFWILLLFLAFPTSFFFLALYPESLFFFLTSVFFYLLYKKKFAIAAVFGFAAGTAKIQGALLFIPFLFSVLAVERLSLQKFLDSVKKRSRHLLFLSISPLLGLFAYSAFLAYRYGDPLYFLHAQSAFGANRSGDTLILLPQVLYRYGKIFLTSDWNFQFFVSVFEFFIFVMVFGVVLYELYRIVRKRVSVHPLVLGIHLFSLSSLILPTLTGTLSSIPRYALIAYSFFFIIGTMQAKYGRYVLLLLFIVLHLWAFLFFTRGYFVS